MLSVCAEQSKTCAPSHKPDCGLFKFALLRYRLAWKGLNYVLPHYSQIQENISMRILYATMFLLSAALIAQCPGRGQFARFDQR